MQPITKHLLMFTLLLLAGWCVTSAQSPVGNDSGGGESLSLLLVDNSSQFDPDSEKNLYCNKLRLQNINITAGDLNDGDNLFLFHRVDDKGVDVVFATLNLHAAGYNPRVVVPSLTYNQQSGYDVLNYESRSYSMADAIDLYGIIDYVSDEFEAVTADNTHSTYYNYYVSFGANDAGLQTMSHSTESSFLQENTAISVLGN